MRILIDIGNIIPGKGGAGGGIWVYAHALLTELDQLEWPEGWEIFCLKHKDNTVFSARRIQLIDAAGQDGPVQRLIDVQLRLPVLCRRLKIDLVHRVIPELPVFNSVRQVCTLHDFMFRHYLESPELRRYMRTGEKAKFRIFSLLTRLACIRADRILVPTQTIAAEARKRVPSCSGKLAVTPEAASGEQLMPAMHYRKGEPLHLICVAGFYPHKGQRQVITLAERLRDLNAFQFRITLRGNPAYPVYEKEIREAIRRKGLDAFFSFPEFTREHDLKAMYQGQHLFLLLSSYEGFGLPLIEAQRSGLPVLCSDIPVFREVLGASALYMDRENPESGISALMRLVQEPENWAELLQRTAENARRFSWEKMARETLAVYQQIGETKS